MLNIITKKADKTLYNNLSEYFIPVACHYDANTLLTKNGQLIQIIQINGISSENVSEKLFNLRQIVREAIQLNVKDDNFAFWIHTIRRKTNLDDNSPYNKLLSANIHNIWCNKNYWNDKFVNTLYISIVYAAPQMKIKSSDSFLSSLLYKSIVSLHEKYYVTAFNELNTTVDNILKHLSEYGAKRLTIRFQDGKSYSDPMFLYRRIVHLNEQGSLVPITDLSIALGSSRYAIGSDKVEIIDESTRKFASILSIKEYAEISSDSLDLFLQLPVELVATEVFYFVESKKVTSTFDHQAYVLKVSGDTKLNDIKGIKEIMDDSSNKRFCYQQISIMIIGEDIEKLELDTSQASSKLSKIGIVHVREDINLEQTFWAQLPGNFIFLRRLTPTILKNTAALASLHNFPTGRQHSIWGKAVTLLRTEKGTPYFFNFHDKTNNGKTCIFGTKSSGKTTLLNFLISEAIKFDPKVYYFTIKESSKIFIEGSEGKWVSNYQGIINPFLFENTPETIIFLVEFLKIICNHYTSALSDQEITFLQALPEKILTLDFKDRNFNFILNNFDFSASGGEAIKMKLSAFAKNNLYENLFEVSENKLSNLDIVAFNLNEISDQSFYDRFYPDDKKLLEKFKSDLQFHGSVRFALIYSLIHYFANQNKEDKKIFVMDDLEKLVNLDCFSAQLEQVSDLIRKVNGIFVSTFELNEARKFKDKQFWKDWIKSLNTQIILPSEYKLENIDKMLDLKRFEAEKLFAFLISSRMFLIKQDGKSIATELSIGGLVAITKILSCKPEDLEIYKSILQSNEVGADVWLKPLYEALE